MFAGSEPFAVALQRRSPQTTLSVAEPYDFGDCVPGLPSAFCASASMRTSGANATIAKGKIAINPMYLSDCFMELFNLKLHLVNFPNDSPIGYKFDLDKIWKKFGNFSKYYFVEYIASGLIALISAYTLLFFHWGLIITGFFK